MIIAVIILSVLCFGELLYIAWNLHRSSIKRLEDESQMKELESLFKEKVAECQKIVDEDESYITFFVKYFDQLSKIIRISDAKIKEIDHKGSFKADDEIGFFFDNIKEIQETLNEFDLTRPIVKRSIEKGEDPYPITPDGKGITDENYIPFEKVQELIK